MLVGGYAVAAHGYPRFTGDIDIWIESTKENASKMIRMLAEFGFVLKDLTVEDFTEEDTMIQLGFPPNRIDIMTGVSGLKFDECWKEKEEITMADETVSLISLKHLKINKKQKNRDKDRIDLKNFP